MIFIPIIVEVLVVVNGRAGAKMAANGRIYTKMALNGRIGARDGIQ